MHKEQRKHNAIFFNMVEIRFLILFKVIAKSILYPSLSANHLHTQALHHSPFDTNYSLPATSQASKSINFNSTITMPQQGPGTKLVLKGLKRAFPKIAEQREQEEREEWEEQESRKREHVSHNTNGENRQTPSIHSNSGHLEDHGQSREHSRHGSSVHSNAGSRRSHTQPEGSIRPESVRGGPSVHSNAYSPGSHGQSRDHTRSGSVRQRHSTHSKAGNRESHGKFKDNVPPEITLQRPSIHSNAGNSENRGSQYPSRDSTRPENVGQRFSIHSNSENRGSHSLSERNTHKSIHPSLATELQRGEPGLTSALPASTRRSARGASEEAAEYQTDADQEEFRHPASRSQQSLVRPDGFSHPNRVSEGSFNRGSRRAASTQDAVESRETTTHRNGRRPGGERV